ncbi:MAG: NifB/NifX family molybdenum-iron cluster-binding protein [Pseudomonadota bacterium]
MADTLRIAVATMDALGLEGEVSAHFGRCPTYTVVEVVDGCIGPIQVAPNPHYENHVPGLVPRFVHSLGAHVVLAGGMGPRAIQIFESLGIQVATGTVGRTGAVVQAWLDGHLRGTVPCAHDHQDSCGGHGH